MKTLVHQHRNLQRMLPSNAMRQGNHHDRMILRSHHQMQPHRMMTIAPRSPSCRMTPQKYPHPSASVNSSANVVVQTQRASGQMLNQHSFISQRNTTQGCFTEGKSPVKSVLSQNQASKIAHTTNCHPVQTPKLFVGRSAKQRSFCTHSQPTKTSNLHSERQTFNHSDQQHDFPQEVKGSQEQLKNLGQESTEDQQQMKKQSREPLCLIGFGGNGQKMITRILQNLQSLDSLGEVQIIEPKVASKQQSFGKRYPPFEPLVAHQALPFRTSLQECQLQHGPSIFVNTMSNSKSLFTVYDQLQDVYKRSKDENPRHRDVLFCEASEHIHPGELSNAFEKFQRHFPDWHWLELTFSGITPPTSPFEEKLFATSPTQHETHPLSNLYYERIFPWLPSTNATLLPEGVLPGTGQLLKLLNSSMTATNLVGVAEANSLGYKFGVTAKTQAQLGDQYPSWVLEKYNPWPSVSAGAPASNTYNVGYSAAQMARDLSLLEQICNENGLAFPMGRTTAGLYKHLAKTHWRDFDFSCIQQHLEELSLHHHPHEDENNVSSSNLALTFTCNVCTTRQTRTFSKMSYRQGVVIVRCDGCRNLHLVADHLGWFNDHKFDLENLPPEQWRMLQENDEGTFQTNM